MRMRLLLLLFILITAGSIFGQGGITISADGQVKDLKSINKRGVEFVSARQLASALKAGIYFNSENGKIELKFDDSTLKLTSGSKFVVMISKSTGKQDVRQMPLAAIREEDDIFIPIEFCTEIFSSASRRQLAFNSASGEITAGNLSGTEKSLLAKNVKPEKADMPLTTDKSAVEKTETSVLKEDKNKKKEETDKEEPSSEKNIESETSADPKYDIQSVAIENKSNGTLIRIRSRKKIGQFSSTVKDGTLYLNLLGLSADEKKIESSEAEGLVKKINVKKVGSNTQMEFALLEGYSSTEAFREGNDLLITIHNKFLSKLTSAQERQKERWSLNTVVIDAGHGGKDPGTIGVDGIKEKDINLAIALKLGRMIQDNMEDVKVVYTRSTDNFVELYKRGKIANEKNGNIFISIHCNATPTKPSGANGFEIYLLRPGRTKEAISIAERENSVIQYEDNRSHYQKLTAENFILVTMAHSSYMRYSEQFSGILNKQFEHDLTLSSNGVKQAGFYVLVGASMPSVLVEAGFLSNRKDAEYLNSKTGQSEIAASIFRSIKTFKSEYDKVMQAGL